ncbi:alpha/beta hydrolase [Lachnospiraceae bacterium OttesenSCG-928-D06]|nr:alpha/beta hydrolase [Lachnospiraceae bacterium OttesenSCG-928-D06]
MIHQIIPIQVEGSLPDTKLVTYIQEDSDSLMIRKRPLILICPGGGYGFTSDREAESMALQFLAMGYHAAVLRYSYEPARYPTALLEVAKSVILLRENASKWHIDENKIAVQGCSAGGHLAASFGMFWKQDFVREQLGRQDIDVNLLKPNGLILCYPVITSGEFAHQGSFENLLGEEGAHLRDKLSLETQVTKDVPPTFLWHTYEDQAVPVENSLLLVCALRKQGIPTEFHMYPKGGHGLSLANHLTQSPDGSGVQLECQTWISLVHTWMEGI